VKIIAYINDDRIVFDSDDDNDNGYKTIESDKGDFILFEDSEIAGKEAREYWEDMAENDSKEFVCMVGEETLVAWALGQYAGPGSTHVQSLNEWLDLWLNTPEEHFASYDNCENTFISKHPDYCDYTIAYRSN